MRSTGQGPCLLGKTWGYDETGIWVSDGCSGEFVAGRLEVAAAKPSGPASHPERRVPAVRRRKGPDLFPAFQLRPLSESAEHRRDLHRRVRQYPHRAAAAGHPAAEVLRAVLRLVPHAEVPLLPVRLVVERVAGRSGAGRRRRQPELHLQPVRHCRRRHHVAADRAQHRRPVPVLARRRRPPDRRRVLPRLVHQRRLGEGRAPGRSSNTTRCSRPT